MINKLAENRTSYIPYRDSKLTRLLSNALGGNSLTAMICTVSPAAQNYYQTLSTLRFASRAKIIKNKAMLNEITDDKSALEFYKNEVRRLQKELQNLKMNTSGNSLMDRAEIVNKEMLEQVMKTNESLSNELEKLKQKYLNEKKESLNKDNLNRDILNQPNYGNQHGNQMNQANHVNSYNQNNNVVISSNPNSNNFRNPNNTNLMYSRPGFNPSNTNSLQVEYSNIDRSNNNQYGFYPNSNNSNNPNKPNFDNYSKFSKDYSRDLNYNYGNVNNYSSSYQNPNLNTNQTNTLNSVVNTSHNNSNIYNTGEDRFLKDYIRPNQSKLQYDYQKVSESFYIDSILSKISQNSGNNSDKNKILKSETERIASDYK